MSFKFLGGKGQVYSTRGSIYTADANGIVTVSSPVSLDINDLLNEGLIPLGQLQGLSNLSATTDPVAGSDNTLGYAAASVWLNTSTGVEWRCASAATGAAVWVPAVGGSMLLGRIIGANMNVTTDQPIVLTNWSVLNPYRITKITVKNASISLTTAAGGIYPAASKGGTAIVAAGQVYTALTAANIAVDLTIAAATTVFAKNGTPILSLTTAQGAAATADLYMYGDVYV